VALDERPKAQQWAQNFRVDGSTNINEALLTAINTADLSEQGKTRPHIIVFLTDGQPTVGVTDISTIIQNAKKAIHGQTSLYTIGVGADVNLPLLDTLAQDNRGTGLLVTATETLEKTLGKFHAAINNPVLVNLALNFGGMQVYDVYPNPIPDISWRPGRPGRYKKGGPTTVTLTGSINGQAHTSTYQNIKFIENADDAVAYSFVSRLWAQRKVDALLRKLSVDGPDPKIADEIRDLGLKYNIITPYTSFVVTNPKDLPAAGLPFLYVDEYRTVNTGLIVVGGCLVLLGVVGLAISRLTRRYA
jgi:Ca-activated chloride channel family protein